MERKTRYRFLLQLGELAEPLVASLTEIEGGQQVEVLVRDCAAYESPTQILESLLDRMLAIPEWQQPLPWQQWNTAPFDD